jgi:DNA-binding NtrC family response regulator
VNQPFATHPLERQGTLTVRTLTVEVVAGPDAGRCVEAPEDRLTVGTALSNHLVMSDPTISRFHLELVNEGSAVRVRDLGSRNGTEVSGVLVERARIHSGAELVLGRSRLRVLDGAPTQIDAHEAPVLAGMLGDAPSMRRLMGTIQRVAPTNVAVLIGGESGTGKELVARAVHAQSARAAEPFVVVDCGALTPTLISSALFGHERGAFTGADRRHSGAFERARGGSVFLDEIGELPLELQPQLLGVLERKRFVPLGGTKELEANVRVIAATNRDLRSAVNRGSFREDLYYRLAVVTLALPPLRERQADLPLLVEHFFREAGGSGPLEAVFTPDVWAQLKRHGWPGNVRELRNFVEAMLVTGEMPRATEAPDADGASFDFPAPLFERVYSDARSEVLSAFEKRYLARLLEGTQGNVSGAARRASMDRSYLIKLLEKHGLK